MTLFDTTDPHGSYGRRSNPTCHSHDPEPSHQAAAGMERSGKRARHQGIVLGLVRANPRRTACELWADADAETTRELAELQEVRRRLTDLKAVGLVRECGYRPCEVRGTNQTTWEVVP